jgi:hypothetical protein
MILYRPTDGDVESRRINLLPRTCFIMTKLGDDVPPEIEKIRNKVESILERYEYKCIDADSKTTGKDFLIKIWKFAMGVPLGIAIIDETINSQTMANIFYEVGWMQATGKETLIIKTPKAKVPSDFVRTEHVVWNSKFETKVTAYLDGLDELAEYYGGLGEELGNNPLLAIDYYRRAFLISGDSAYQTNAKTIINNIELGNRAKNCVEFLHSEFALHK